MKSSIAILIENERKNKGYSINELSKRSGVPYSTLAQIEKGFVVPQIVTAEKIINALGYEFVMMKMPEKNLKEN
jgi:transcriptional regulator with XRE-family HTH domain